jgi:hypothetical protein
MSFKLDLGKMKHVSSDDKSTMLKHPRGHTVTLYHNVLSKENQNALKALSKVGPQAATANQAQESQDQNQYGKVIQKASGGPISRDATNGVSSTGHEKGVHRTTEFRESDKKSLGQSDAGEFNRLAKHGHAEKSDAIGEHKKVLSEMRSMPNPNIKGMASGGKVPPNKKQDLPYGGTTPGQPQAAMMADGGWMGSTSSPGGTAPAPAKSSDQTPPPNPEESAASHEKAASNNAGSGASTMQGVLNRFSNAWAEGGKISYNNAQLATKGEDMLRQKHTPTEQQTQNSRASFNAAEQHLKPEGKRKRFADGGEAALPVPSGGNVPTPSKPKSSIDKLIDMKHAESIIPKDEAGTEKELDAFDASQGPSAIERTLQDKQQARNTDQEPAQEMSPVLQPGMPGYGEESKPIDDVEQPPQGGSNQINQGNDHYGHLNAQGTGNGQAAPPQTIDGLEPSPQLEGDQSTQQPLGTPNTQLPQYQAAQPNTQGQPPNTKQDMLDEANNFEQDLNNGHIKPETYHDLFAKKSTLGKIGSIFGLIIGGMGSGLTHQPNAALEMMNNEIKNDLAAQEKSKDNAQNFVKINQQRLLNEADIPNKVKQGLLTDAQAEQARQEALAKGFNTSQMMMNSAAFHQLVETGKKLPPGPQRDAYMQAITGLGTQIQQEHYNIADKQAAMEASMNPSAGPSQQNPEVAFQNKQRTLLQSGRQDIANDNESKHVPGIQGQASRPLTPQDRDKIMGHQKLTAGLADLNNTLNQISSYNHYSPEYIKGVEKIQKLQSDIRDSTLGTVYKQGEQPLLDQIIKMPIGDITKYQTRAQIQELNNMNNRDYGVLKQQLGFPVTTPAPQQRTQQQQGFVDWAKKHPDDSRAKQIFQKLGQ